MQVPRTTVLALTLLAVVSALAAGQDKDASYYPLKVGTKWTYQASGKTFVAQVVKVEPIDKTPCAVVEITVDGKTLATSEHLAATADGIYRYASGGEKYTPPLCILKLPPK